MKGLTAPEQSVILEAGKKISIKLCQLITGLSEVAGRYRASRCPQGPPDVPRAGGTQSLSASHAGEMLS